MFLVPELSEHCKEQQSLFSELAELPLNPTEPFAGSDLLSRSKPSILHGYFKATGHRQSREGAYLLADLARSAIQALGYMDRLSFFSRSDSDDAPSFQCRRSNSA